jgi:hypothetical protein
MTAYPKHSHLLYSDRSTQPPSVVPCTVVSVHLDNGPDEPYYTIRFLRGGEIIEKQTQPDRLSTLPPAEFTVRVVHIKDLLSHLGRGWTESQLLSGKVAVLGKSELTLVFTEDQDATVLKLAERVCDEWGPAVEDQSYRIKGRALVPKISADAGVDLRMIYDGSEENVVLLTGEGGDSKAGSGGGGSGGLKTAERSFSSTATGVVEAPSDDRREAAAATAATVATQDAAAFGGKGNVLGSSNAAPAQLSPTSRRRKAAEAAEKRFGKR